MRKQRWKHVDDESPVPQTRQSLLNAGEVSTAEESAWPPSISTGVGRREDCDPYSSLILHVSKRPLACQSRGLSQSKHRPWATYQQDLGSWRIRAKTMSDKV